MEEYTNHQDVCVTGSVAPLLVIGIPPPAIFY